MSDAKPPADHTEAINIEDEMKASYLDYAMSVIIGRALPDVRDGLKPVHRRVLFAMQDLGNSYNRSYKKSARIVGDVIGKYHPHGDQAVYDTLVRMAQDFSMRHVLVDGQGNFGSIDGDRAAAMRYTEVRMAKLASELLADIDKETVDFGPNYDDSLVEPLVLPTRFPNLLVNGSSGIAVGMATNIPPHNLQEVIDGTVYLARNPSASILDLMKFVPGPDFPTGGIVLGNAGVQKALATGRGIVKVRGKAHVEDWKKDRERIVITEIPYQVNKTSLIEKAADLVRDKRIEGISDIRDESDREGMRVVVELKRDVSGEIVLNQLYRLTQLQSSFGYNMLAIVKGQPRVLNIKDIMGHFIDHRREVVTRRSLFELREANKRFNVVFGLLAAIDAIDRIITIIRSSKDTDEARMRLMAEKLPMSPAFTTFASDILTIDYETGKNALERGHMLLNERQAQAILDMRLARLTGLERDKLEKEALALRDTIQRLEAILGDDELLLNVVIEELEEVKQGYANPRRTTLEVDTGEIEIEDLIEEEEMVVTLSHLGYIKRVPSSTYRAQNRGGRGKTGATTRDEDFVTDLFVASTHTYIMVFSNQGKAYWLKVHQIPQGSRTAKGKPIINLLPLDKGERVMSILPVKEFTEGHYLMFCTAQGLVKKTDLMSFAKPRPSGLIALGIAENDTLIDVRLTDGKQEVLLCTREGMTIRFNEEDVRPMGRSARGVRGVKLKKEGDKVVGMVIIREDVDELLTVSDNGMGKRTIFDDYRVQGRGGSGIINLKITDKNGPVAGVAGVKAEDQLMVVTDRGMMIRMHVGQISVLGRATQGVRIISTGDDEVVTSVARIVESEEEEDEALD